MDKIDIYYDHYKETCELSKQAQKRRNGLFVWLCVLEALSFLFLINPDQADEFLTAGINARFEINIVLGNVILQTLLWILIAYITVRYCQETLYVERQYSYMNQLEKEIVRESGMTLFEREGQGYLKAYPMVLNFIDLFYKLFCPVLFMGINIARIVSEWQSGSLTTALICDTAIFAEIFVIIWFYFFEIHSRITAWCKRHIPLIRRIAELLRKALKKV